MLMFLAKALMSARPDLTLKAAIRIVRAVLIALAVIAVGVGGCVAKRHYDSGVVERARAVDNAEATAAAADANVNAADRRAADVVRAAGEARELEEAINVPDPDAARRAYYRCVRLQQQARAADRPAPACN